MEFPIIPLITVLFSHSKNNMWRSCCALQFAKISQDHSFIPHTFMKHLPHARHSLLVLQSAFSSICQKEPSKGRDQMCFWRQEGSILQAFLRAKGGESPGVGVVDGGGGGTGPF